MSFKPIDPKRDEYRRYLERGGIIESLTKVFVRILKERPEDPTQYLLQNLGDARLQADNIAYLQSELEDARIEIQRLTKIIQGINPELLNEPPSNVDNSNNDSVNENIDKSQVVNGTSLVVTCEQNLQSVSEYPEAVLLESLQNTHINETTAQAATDEKDMQSEVVSNAE